MIMSGRFRFGRFVVGLGLWWFGSRGLPRSQLARVRSRNRATALALSQEEAHHARLRRARAAPRWLESLRAPYEATAPARGLSLSVHGRVSTR